MTISQISLIVSCVLAISIGQLLFKKVSMNINQSQDWFSLAIFGTFSLAILIYGLATLFWIYILRNVPLNKAYGFMALSFVFVAIGSCLFFNEKITFQLLLGICCIIFGLLLISNG